MFIVRKVCVATRIGWLKSTSRGSFSLSNRLGLWGQTNEHKTCQQPWEARLEHLFRSLSVSFAVLCDCAYSYAYGCIYFRHGFHREARLQWDNPSSPYQSLSKDIADGWIDAVLVDLADLYSIGIGYSGLNTPTINQTLDFSISFFPTSFSTPSYVTRESHARVRLTLLSLFRRYALTHIRIYAGAQPTNMDSWYPLYYFILKDGC